MIMRKLTLSSIKWAIRPGAPSLELGVWVLPPMVLSYPRAAGGRLQQLGGANLVRVRVGVRSGVKVR